jgi:DNA ligase-1
MSAFSQLFQNLDETNSINEKVALLADFFLHSCDKDAVWVLAIFSGKRPKGIIKSGQLREWSAEYAKIPLWLLEECYYVVGDLAETTAKILPHSQSQSSLMLHEQMDLLQQLKEVETDTKKSVIISVWQNLSQDERLVFNKLITGGFRTGVSQRIIAKGLAKAFELDFNQVLYALSGDWNPNEVSLKDILSSDKDSDNSKPYPFCLAFSHTEKEFETALTNDFLIEWKFDGIRAQVIKRKEQVYIWSRGEEIITQKFPEIVAALHEIKQDCVLDGEILVWNHQQNVPENFAAMQKRVATKKPSAKLLASHPCIFMAYDILEKNKEDIRATQLNKRRILLEQLLLETHHVHLKCSESIAGITSWGQAAIMRSEARNKRAEGLMLKRLDASYESGRKKGVWWKWKIDPMTFDAVLIYAQRGHGRRANLYSDFTFAVKKDDTLVPIAKAYSGLTDAEMKEVNVFIKSNTLQSFGPVRSVKAVLVFEIAFEGIQKSSRHIAGIAVRFPRIARWRKDKEVEDIDTIENLEKLI